MELYGLIDGRLRLMEVKVKRIEAASRMADATCKIEGRWAALPNLCKSKLDLLSGSPSRSG